MNNKYRAKPQTENGIRFDSKREAARYQELYQLWKAGVIKDLKLQHAFVLQDGFTTPDGERIRAIEYRADFTYMQDGELVVEDVKSKATKTPVYEIKRKMLADRYGLSVREV